VVAIFVALMFVGFLLVDLVLQKVQAARIVAVRPEQIRRGLATAEALARARSFPWGIPQGVYLSEGHAWFEPEPSGEVRVGADALVAHAVGTLDKVVFPKVGDLVRKGHALFHLVHEGRVLTFFSSVLGKVVSINRRLRDYPELVANEPYGAGWVCSVVPAYLDDGSGKMRFGEKAAFWLECEFDRFCGFVSARIPSDLALGATSQDGGVPVIGSLVQLGDEAWSAFETDFLRSR
jgi:glycine cleavage system H lipoate-binding protein